jgi:hypothetical protein
MKKLITILCLTTYCFLVSGQSSEFGLVFGFGPGYFIKDNYLHHQISRNKFFGLSSTFYTKNNNLAFNPSFVYSYDKYMSKLPYYGLCGITQRKFGVNLDMLLKLRKHCFFRVGINFHRLDNSFIEVSYGLTNYNPILISNSNIWYSNGEMYKGYSSNLYQAGIRAGLSVPINLLKQNMKLNVTIDHSASTIVNADYYYKNPTGGLTKVLSKNSTPTKLLVALEVNLRKPKKKEK